MNTDTEIVFEQKIVELAHTFGWKVTSFRQAGGKNGGFRTPVKYDGRGWVDLTLIHPTGYVIFAEIKREKGSTTSDWQVEWGNLLAECAEAINTAVEDTDRVFYRLWKPRDGDEIAQMLSFGRVKEWRP